MWMESSDSMFDSNQIMHAWKLKTTSPTADSNLIVPTAACLFPSLILFPRGLFIISGLFMLPVVP